MWACFRTHLWPEGGSLNTHVFSVGTSQLPALGNTSQHFSTVRGAILNGEITKRNTKNTALSRVDQGPCSPPQHRNGGQRSWEPAVLNAQKIRLGVRKRKKPDLLYKFAICSLTPGVRGMPSLHQLQSLVVWSPVSSFSVSSSSEHGRKRRGCCSLLCLSLERKELYHSQLFRSNFHRNYL